MDSFRDLSLKVRDVYENNAEAFDKQRSKKLFEKKWLDLFLSYLTKNSSLLDLGCGTAEPIAKYLIDQKMNVTGVDFSEKMIEISKRRFPNNSWHVQDMSSLELGRTFNGIIAWNSFFHLTQANQVQAFERIDKHLEKDGVLLLTVGDKEGEVTGIVNSHPVYHSSLSSQGYEDLLNRFNYKLIKFIPKDVDCQDHSVLLAMKELPNPSLILQYNL